MVFALLLPFLVVSVQVAYGEDSANASPKSVRATELECQGPLGMESGAISDEQISASSQWDGNHAASQARLNFKAGGGKQGSWSARTSDQNQWLQVDLGGDTYVTRIQTQGRNAYNQWVTKYKLQFSLDGVSFRYYKDEMEFDANTDSDTVVVHQLNPAIAARYIRLRPVAWHGHISMRIELNGCPATELECQGPLGMESGAISDEQISASSQWDGNHAASQARLNFKAGGGKQGSWSARTSDQNQWLQVDLGGDTYVTRIQTQGRNAYNQWVTKYKLQFSLDGVSFRYYKDEMEFDANTDSDTVVVHQLNPPITARYIRVRPVAWHGHISMRIELNGCPGMECGKKAAGGRIVGGIQAAPGAWPWQVTLDYLGHHLPHWCGGTIVTPQWIVTAAHCFANSNDPKQYTIVAGQHDLNAVSGFEQNIPIHRIIKHPQYAAHRNHDFDIALIKLQSPLMFNTRVRPACLPQFDFDVGTNCYVTGWGHTSEGGNIPQILHQAQVPLVSRQVCQSGYPGSAITPRMRCAGYAAGGIDACQGDSGGPLVCAKDNKWYLMGAVSWGIGCARPGRYGVYADLIDLQDWVQGIMNSE